MLTSLFGDLAPADRPAGTLADGLVPPRGLAGGAEPWQSSSLGRPASAATVATEPLPSDVDADDGSGFSPDRRTREWLIDSSPADAIRRQFASARADLAATSGLITLYDPVALWAPAVVKALSDVGGQPIQRLLLREHGTLRLLAAIERAALPRRQGDALHVCHADPRAAGGAHASQVLLALMERSQLAAVIIGPLAPAAVDRLLAELLAATQQPGWGCPHLLFLLPPGAVWIANRIDALDWPAALTVIQRDEVLTSVSAVWNALLALWDELHPQPAAANSGGSAGTSVVADGVALTAPPDVDLAMAPPAPASLPAAQRARQSLAGLLQVDGLLACAVVDGRNGAIIARETREDQPVDLDLAAAASAQAVRAHRLSARAMGANDSVDELIVSAGARQLMLRTSPSHPDVFILALLDRERADPGLARTRLIEVERRLS